MSFTPSEAEEHPVNATRLECAGRVCGMRWYGRCSVLKLKGKEKFEKEGTVNAARLGDRERIGKSAHESSACQGGLWASRQRE